MSLRRFSHFKWKTFIIIFLNSFLIQAFSFQSLATQMDLPRFHLGEIVVTATRTERLLSGIPAYGSIVRKDNIERQKVFTLDEVLRYQAGLSSLMVQDETGTSGHISLRGFRGQGRTQLLLNGNPMNGGYNGQVDWAGLPIEIIDRIEIVRGPYSALYGGSAMGGTIQIISREIEKTTICLKGLYGDDNTRGYRLFIGARPWDRLSFSMGYEGRQTDGFIDQYVVKTASPSGGGGGGGGGGSSPQQSKTATGWTTTNTPTGESAYLIGDKGEHWGEIYGFTSQINFDVTSSMKIKGFFMHQNSKNGYKNPNSYLSDYNTGEILWNGTLKLDPEQPGINFFESSFLNGDKEIAKNIYQVSFHHAPNKILDYNLRAGFTDEYRNLSSLPDSTAMIQGGTGTLTETPSTAFQMEGEASFSVREKHNITIGLGNLKNEVEDKDWVLSDWRHPSLKVERRRKTEGEDNTLYAFIQNEYIINDGISILAGIRYDHWDSEGKQADANRTMFDFGKRRSENYSPRLGIIYHPFSRTGLRAMFGKAFRTPPLHALYRTNISSKRITQMNPELDPERTTCWELGIDQEFPEGIGFRFTYFDNAITNMIYPRLINPETSPETYRKENAGKGRTRGIELEIEYITAAWLTLWGNWTYQEAKIVKNPANSASEGKRVPQVPWCMVNIGLDAEIGNFYATLAGHYAGKVYKQDDNSDFITGVPEGYDPYFILNAKVGYTLIKYITLSVAIDNILDREYYEFNKTPSRRIFGELSYTF